MEQGRKVSDTEACCGGPPPPGASEFDRPGYVLQPFVLGFRTTSAGDTPVIGTRLSLKDRLDAVGVRSGFNRYGYRVAPGLYALGDPDPTSPVLVTSNYKLTFDTLRSACRDLSAWLLVLDTHGVNVWCAAGKKTFSTDEIARLVLKCRLSEVVTHRELLLPQLGASGVSAREVKRRTGFQVTYGPVEAVDLPRFLKQGGKIDPAMRRVTFPLPARAVLIPVEIHTFLKRCLWLVPVLMLLSGLVPGGFSPGAAWHRGVALSGALLAGLVAGSAFVPLLLPWIPGRALSLKGAITGAATALPFLTLVPWSGLTPSDRGATALLICCVSSWQAMNFTGCTPYTSASGVEKEMKHALPFQFAGVLLAASLWFISPFV